ncbi:SDR family oxidoreductase [Sporosarcina oncorhynchi]|uniref:SDR family oxidoreductase n=1 Tax=Sporosarcina oncorhynchi TaxID=3056444 RepID=A0ABZ0L7M9_9BACL|nr:SDR family oxidoreductase [Sporosarcina sp. T2O-4]WOV88130.1 SDR family oxidoreductase [Sporosarcina sp. T2O-4]
MNLKDKVIIVTGAAGGMGKAIVKRLAEKQAIVVGIDLSASNTDEKPAGQVTYKSANILEEGKVSDLFAEIYEKYGRIDGLVNAIGVAQSKTPIEEVSLDMWYKMMNINATSLFITIKEVAKYMKKRQSGSIITISSVSAVRPRPGLQAYIASKGAAESFTRAMAIELAPFSIRANTIHPGPSNTGMLGQFAQQDAAEEETKNLFKQSVPLGELIEPDDIAHSVVYLLSDEARMVTGATLHVDGGRGL